jgi:hypothetical protein
MEQEKGNGVGVKREAEEGQAQAQLKPLGKVHKYIKAVYVLPN